MNKSWRRYTTPWRSGTPRAAAAVDWEHRPKWCCGLLILKHIRNWSYAALEREVRANLVYRDFTRVGAAKMPDAKTMGRWGVAVGPSVLKRDSRADGENR